LSLLGIVTVAVLLARQWYESRPVETSSALRSPDADTREGDASPTEARDVNRRVGTEDLGQADDAVDDEGIQAVEAETAPTPLSVVPYVKDGVLYGWAVQWSARDFYAQSRSSNNQPYRGL